MYILKARITSDWKDNHLILFNSLDTCKVFKQSSTHMSPHTSESIYIYVEGMSVGFISNTKLTICHGLTFLPWLIKYDHFSLFTDSSICTTLIHNYNHNHNLFMQGHGLLWHACRRGWLGKVKLLSSLKLNCDYLISKLFDKYLNLFLLWHACCSFCFASYSTER